MHFSSTITLPLCLGLIEQVLGVPATTPSPASRGGKHKKTASKSSGNSVDARADAWWPPVGSSWQIVLNAPVKVPSSAAALVPNANVWDIDLYMNPAESIDGLKHLGKGVICYFSAGSYEPYRPDSSQFKSLDFGNTLEGWPDEKWLDILSTNVRNIMTARMKLAKSKGCDAVDPDNVDGYNNDNGLGLTQQDSIDYMKFLSSTAAQIGISIGLKNALEVLPQVTSLVQLAVNEQCFGYSECDNYIEFVKTGRNVFHIEYPNAPIGKVKAKELKNICTAAGLPADPDPKVALSTVIKNSDLSGVVQFCNGTIVTTPTN